MTKQYAETGTNEKRSQVCARLPLQIQLFAEESGEAEADTDTEGAAGSTGAGLCDCRYGEKFDDLLKDKKFQSEFDSRVSKALATARAKWVKAPRNRRTKQRSCPT